MGVNSLPKTVTRQRRGCDLNPGTAPESSTLTTRLPSHPGENSENKTNTAKKKRSGWHNVTHSWRRKKGWKGRICETGRFMPEVKEWGSLWMMRAVDRQRKTVWQEWKGRVWLWDNRHNLSTDDNEGSTKKRNQNQWSHVTEVNNVRSRQHCVWVGCVREHSEMSTTSQTQPGVVDSAKSIRKQVRKNLPRSQAALSYAEHRIFSTKNGNGIFHPYWVVWIFYAHFRQVQLDLTNPTLSPEIGLSLSFQYDQTYWDKINKHKILEKYTYASRIAENARGSKIVAFAKCTKHKKWICAERGFVHQTGVTGDFYLVKYGHYQYR